MLILPSGRGVSNNPVIAKKHNIKKGTLMKSLRVAFFGSLSGPDLIQSWELFSESKTDIKRIERCLKSL